MNNVHTIHQVQVPQAVIDKGLAESELQRAVMSSHEVLISATTVFPFTLFPDTITLDREKITVTKKEFFSVGEIMSFRIADLLSVSATLGPIFGSIKISSRFYDSPKPYSIKYLWRGDALKLKCIIQGNIIAAQKKIDTSALSTAELVNMLDKLGEGTPDDAI